MLHPQTHSISYGYEHSSIKLFQLTVSLIPFIILQTKYEWIEPRPASTKDKQYANLNYFS